MTAAHDDIATWFDEGVVQGATHMLVVCDNFSHDDYPVYVMTGEDAEERASKYDGSNMQSLMEVYNLSLDKGAQMNETRVFNY